VDVGSGDVCSVELKAAAVGVDGVIGSEGGGPSVAGLGSFKGRAVGRCRYGPRCPGLSQRIDRRSVRQALIGVFGGFGA
jgi:hypothetical protein